MQLWPNKLKVKITRLQKDTDATNLVHRLRDLSKLGNKCTYVKNVGCISLYLIFMISPKIKTPVAYANTRQKYFFCMLQSTQY
jgi:hypothetical protein